MTTLPLTGPTSTAGARGAQVLAIAVGSVALLMLGLQPLLLGALLEAGHVTLEGVGLVAMGEIVALGLGVLIGDLWLPARSLRSITAIAALAAAALHVLTMRASGDLALGLVRAAAGVAEGVMVWSTTAVIVRSAAPERLAGLFFVVQTLTQAVLGLALAHLVIPVEGWPGAFALLAALCVVVAALAAGLARPLGPLVPTVSQAGIGFAWTRPRLGTLLVAFLQLSTLGALWAYAEPLGTRAGFSPLAVQTLIAAGLGMQVLGGSVGTALVRRLPVRAALLGCAVVLGLSAFGVARTAQGGTVAFAVLCGLFTFTWLFMLPFQMALAMRVDGSGQVASLVPAAQLFGSAFGPLIASLVVTGEDVAPVPFVATGFAVLAILALPLTRAPLRPSAD
ncbi:MFS transporter [Mitsuaria sp. GD03876]|uniref:MFS transporter n=1 Tax=Mitsuaria sp. GD03876 TaxID=2975399 RepID=UPI00244C239B|nr:MFS transporter [Mitsuaria sp. GD03876]MDH0863937.1 MFS transporter [Mitsuaria sp. GD03876]